MRSLCGSGTLLALSIFSASSLTSPVPLWQTLLFPPHQLHLNHASSLPSALGRFDWLLMRSPPYLPLSYPLGTRAPTSHLPPLLSPLAGYARRVARRTNSFEGGLFTGATTPAPSRLPYCTSLVFITESRSRPGSQGTLHERTLLA